MPYVGPHKIYIRDRTTPLFPNAKTTQPMCGVNKNGFGGYFQRMNGERCDRGEVWGTITDGLGGQLLSEARVKAFFAKGYYIDQDGGESFYPCLAYFGGKVWPGYTMGN